MFKKNIFLIQIIFFLCLLMGCSHSHSYKEQVIKPTCLEQGYTIYICKCGDTYKDNYIDELGHSYSAWEIIKEATEDETGLKEQQCIRCGYKKEKIIAKLEHIHQYDIAIINPTCSDIGYTKYTCKCGDTYKDTYIDELGHSYGAWEIVKEATEDETGLKEKKCIRCNHKKSELLPKVDKYYSIRIESTLNGVISTNKTSAKAGEIINVSVTPNEGYILDENSLMYNRTIIRNGTFMMPECDVVISADFKKIFQVRYFVNGEYTAYANVVEGKTAPYPYELTNDYYMFLAYKDMNCNYFYNFMSSITENTNIYCVRKPRFFENACLGKPVANYKDEVDILTYVIENATVTLLAPAYLGFYVEANQTIIISTDTSYLNMSEMLMFSLAGAYGEASNGGAFTRLERGEDWKGNSFIIMEFNKPGIYYVAVTYSTEAVRKYGTSFLSNFAYVFKATAMIDNGYLLE